MPNSLMDFGGAARNAIQLGQLEETSRRNDLYEQNSLLQVEQQKIERERLKQSASFRAFDEIEKVRARPEFALNQKAQVNFTLTQGQLLGGIMGKPVPMPSQEELMGGYQEMQGLMDTMRTGDRTQKIQAFQTAMIANPSWAGKILDDMKKVGEVSGQMEEMALKLEMNKGKLEQLNLKNAHSTMLQGAFTEHAGALAQVTGIATDPDLKQSLHEVMSLKTTEQQQAYMKIHPGFAKSFQAKIDAEKQKMGFIDPSMQVGGAPLEPTLIGQLDSVYQSKKDAMKAAQARIQDGLAPLELQEEVGAIGATLTARRIQAEWLADPLNKDKWKALNTAEQDLKVRAGLERKKLSTIADQRNELASAKFDLKTQTGLAEADLEEQFLHGMSTGMSENQALGAAIRTVKEKYPTVPFDATKILNAEKKGKLEVSLLAPSVKADLQKDVQGLKPLLSTINDMREIVQKHPEAVGATGNIIRFLGGLGQQARDASRLLFENDVNITPEARKKLRKAFDTKNADDLESYSIGLTYKMARVLSGAGVLSDKDIGQAEKLVSPLKSMRGSDQFLNHLVVIEKEAYAKAYESSQTLQRGNVPTIGRQKPIESMSADEQLDELRGILGVKP